MQQLTIKDYVRLSVKDTINICDVKKGDLVKISHKSGLSKALLSQTIGIVTQTYDDKMCILAGNSGHQWWSRYVNCEIIGYNKKDQ